MKKLSKSKTAALALAASKPNGRISTGGTPGRFRTARNTLRALRKSGLVKHIGSGSGHGPSGTRDMVYTYEITDAGRTAIAEVYSLETEQSTMGWFVKADKRLKGYTCWGPYETSAIALKNVMIKLRICQIEL